MIAPEHPALILRAGLTAIVAALALVRVAHWWRHRETLVDRYRKEAGR